MTHVVVLALLAVAPAGGAAPSSLRPEDLQLETDEDVAVEGAFAVPDADGGTRQGLAWALQRRALHGSVTVERSTGRVRYMPAVDFAGADSFSVTVSDGARAASAAATVQVRPVDDAPVARPVALATIEDTPVRGRARASDVDSPVLTYRVGRAPAHGTATAEEPPGTLLYVPAPDFCGSDSFSVEVSDAEHTTPFEVTVAVAPVNDAPVAAPLAVSLDEDGMADGGLRATDADGDALIYRLLRRPRLGALSVDGRSGAWVYTPRPDVHGADAFTFEVSDGRLKSAETTVTLEVRPVNDAPVTAALALATSEDVAAHGQVIARDVDGDVLHFAIARAPTHGEAAVDALRGTVTYQGAPDFNGVDRFAVGVSDGALSAVAEVSVAVAAVNDAPVLVTSTLVIDEDDTLEAPLVATDVDGDAVTFRLVGRPLYGEATVAPATGALHYRPNKDFFGDDAIAVEVSDGRLKAVGHVALAVRPVNDAPSARPLALATAEDGVASGAIVASDVDSALTYRLGAGPAHGTAEVAIDTGRVTYRPAPDFHGDDAFTVEVSDGLVSVTAPVTVAIAAVDDPPRVHAARLETAEDTPVEARLPATEVDGEALIFRLLSAPALGTAELLDAATGTWRFAPARDRFGDDVLSFEVSDAHSTVRGAVQIHVEPVNDAPTLDDLVLRTREDQAVGGNLVGHDVEGDALRFAAVTSPGAGWSVSVDERTGELAVTPARDFCGRASFTAVVSDGALSSAPATVTIEVAPVNDAPVASDANLTVDEDTLLSGNMPATDIDGDTLSYSLTALPSHGTVTVLDRARGSFEYLPAPNYFGRDSFGFRVTDPSSASSTAKVHLTVKPVNDPPVAIAETIATPRRGVISGRLKGYDRESSSVSFRILSLPAHGQFRLSDPRTGAFTYTTDGSSVQSASVRFVAYDGELTSEPVEITFMVLNT